jgi:hypothetical protein
VASAGEVLPRLPGSIRSLWGAAGLSSAPAAAAVGVAAAPLRLAVASRDVFPLDRPLEGGVRIELEVRRRTD